MRKDYHVETDVFVTTDPLYGPGALVFLSTDAAPWDGALYRVLHHQWDYLHQTWTYDLEFPYHGGHGLLTFIFKAQHEDRMRTVEASIPNRKRDR